jgi:hypothetical protein
VELSGRSIRLASATARRHMLALAAHALEAKPESLEVGDGLVRSISTNRSITYWEMMEGRRFDIAVDPEIAPKSPKAYHQIGRAVVAIDLPALVQGTAPFVHDMCVPGMLHARLVRPPHYHARIAEIDETIHERLGGAHLVHDGSFVAVAAEEEYHAIQVAGRVASSIRWRPERSLDARNVFERLVTEPRISLPVRDGDAFEEPVPPLEPPPDGAVITVHTRVERPYLMDRSAPRRRSRCSRRASSPSGPTRKGSIPCARRLPNASAWTRRMSALCRGAGPAPTVTTGPMTRRSMPRSSRVHSPADRCCSSGRARTSTPGSPMGRRWSSRSGPASTGPGR